MIPTGNMGRNFWQKRRRRRRRKSRRNNKHLEKGGRSNGRIRP